jgi:hypothetical protein
MVLELGRAMEVAGPGAALMRIACVLTTKGQDLLQPNSRIKWIGRQLHLAQCQGQKGLEVATCR